MVKPTTPHDSQRGYFAFHLYDLMEKHPDVYLITCDLGFKMFDAIQDNFPDRFINVGASEQTAVDLAVGLALMKKVPFVYSITPFLLWRPAEAIRIYLGHEGIPVKLVGSGRNDDYKDDGFTHDATDALNLLGAIGNIPIYSPIEKSDIAGMLEDIYSSGRPVFLSLKR